MKTWDTGAEGMAAVLGLGPLEYRIMTVIWGSNTATVADVVLHAGTKNAYTTVKTIMERLEKKGLLRRRREGKAYLYEPAISRPQLEELVSRRLVANLLDSFGSVAISGFAYALKEDPQRMEEMRSLLEKMASGEDKHD